MISSTHNQQVKNLLALQKKARARREQGLYITEGLKMVMEAPDGMVQKVYLSEHLADQPEALAITSKHPYEILADPVFKAVSDTVTPQGVLAVIRQKAWTIEDMLVDPGPYCFLILETVQDPGNLGTMIRTAEGAGISGIIMDETTADVYNPKVIRSTMGSVYRVPFLYTDNLEKTVYLLKEHNVHIYAAHLKGNEDFDQADLTKSCGFLIGNESKGLSESTVKLANSYIKIPMAGKVESLNAAVAAGLLMYESFMQKKRIK